MAPPTSNPDTKSSHKRKRKKQGDIVFSLTTPLIPIISATQSVTSALRYTGTSQAGSASPPATDRNDTDLNRADRNADVRNNADSNDAEEEHVPAALFGDSFVDMTLSIRDKSSQEQHISFGYEQLPFSRVAFTTP